MDVELSNKTLAMLYFGTRNAQKIRSALNTAENIMNSFLEPDDDAKKYLYITNPDGTRFKVEYGAKIENYSITPCNQIESEVAREFKECLSKVRKEAEEKYFGEYNYVEKDDINEK